MRRFDKKNNIKKANILAESLYRQRHNEDFDYARAEKEYHDEESYKNMSIEEFIGTPVSLTRKFNNVHSKEEDVVIHGIFAGIDKSEGIPLMVIEKDGKKVAFILFDKSKNIFVEGMSSWSYVYTPMDADTSELFNRFAEYTLKK
jgi:hypothetical protein